MRNDRFYNGVADDETRGTHPAFIDQKRPVEASKITNPNRKHSSTALATARVSQSASPARRSAFVLSTEERAALRALLASEHSSTRHARRIRVVLLADQGVAGVEIARRLELSVGQVSRIRQRFLQRGVSGLADSPHLGRRDHAVSEQAVALVTALARSPPPVGRQRWSTRLIAAQVGLSSATVAKILRNVRSPPAQTLVPAKSTQ